MTRHENSFEREEEILDFISTPEGKTIDEIMLATGLSRRTVYRYLHQHEKEICVVGIHRPTRYRAFTKTR